MKNIKYVLVILMLLIISACTNSTNNTYTLCFYDINDNVLSTITVEKGVFNQFIDAPNVEGYEFDYWTLDNQAISEVEVTSDLVFYPVYHKIEYYLETQNVEQVVEIGQEYTIEYSIEPSTYNEPIFFYCSDDNILELHDDGTCIGLQKGECVVSVEIENYHLDILVYVVNPGEDPAHMYDNYFKLISSQTVNLNIGTTSQVEIETNLNDIYYVDYQTDIASIDKNGLIHANGLGTTVVEAISKSKNYAATITVNVNGNKLEANLMEPNKTYKVNDFIGIYLNYTIFENGNVSTTNGLDEDEIQLIIDEGPQDIVILDGKSTKVIEPYNGTIMMHYVVNGTPSNKVQISIIESD